MEFAETKTSVFLFLYDNSIDTSRISLNNPKSLFITPYKSIDLYKEVTHIQKIKVHTKCVEIILVKKVPSKWYTLSGPENIDEKKQEQKVVEENDITQDDDIMKVLSKIYQNGDENTRRAMEKSFIESDGTVLSTNWEDVKNKKYEQ